MLFEVTLLYMKRFLTLHIVHALLLTQMWLQIFNHQTLMTLGALTKDSRKYSSSDNSGSDLGTSNLNHYKQRNGVLDIYELIRFIREKYGC